MNAMTLPSQMSRLVDRRDPVPVQPIAQWTEQERAVIRKIEDAMIAKAPRRNPNAVWFMEGKRAVAKPEPKGNMTQKRLWDLLDEPKTVMDLAYETGATQMAISGLLTRMSNNGCVEADHEKRGVIKKWRRAGKPPEPYAAIGVLAEKRLQQMLGYLENPMTGEELSIAIGMTKKSCLNLLGTFCKQGYVKRCGTQRQITGRHAVLWVRA